MSRTALDILEDDLDNLYKRIEKLDPETAFVVGEQVNKALVEATKEVAKRRRTAVRELRMQGYTLQQIGDLVGVSANRVYQIENGIGRNEKGGQR